MSKVRFSYRRASTVTRLHGQEVKALDIKLLDQMVVGNASADPTGLSFYSFRSAGIL